MATATAAPGGVPLALNTSFVRKVRTRLAEESLHDFLRQAWHVVEPATPFIDGWHLGAICDHLQAVTRGEIRNLIINMPPRHAKSLCVSVFWFAWTWIFWPESRWLFSSYAHLLSTRDSVKCRDIILSPWYQQRWPHVQIKGDQNSKDRFENTRTGLRMATSVGGRGTGEGGDIIVVDDPHRADDTYSDSNRIHALQWWDTTMSTRGNNPKTSRRVVVMQRIHEADLTGHLLADERGYDHLCLPCWYESGHPHNTVTSLGWQDPRQHDGELLWPERFGEKEVEDLKKALGGQYNIAGQLQQRPSPDEGGIFRKSYFCYFERQEIDVNGTAVPMLVLTDEHGKTTKVLESDCYWFQACDTALKLGEDNAWTVVGTYLVTPKPHRLLVYDVWRDRVSVPEQYGMLINQRLRYPQVKMQAVEEAQSGFGLIQEGRMKGTPFWPLRADGDKVRRCTSIALQYENRMVYHRAAKQAPWLEAFEHELLFFPAGEFADQVDVHAYAGIIMQAMALRDTSRPLVMYPDPTNVEAEEQRRAGQSPEEQKSEDERVAAIVRHARGLRPDEEIPREVATISGREEVGLRASE